MLLVCLMLAVMLFDVSGNVAEWCFTANGSYRIYKGGSWYYSEYELQVGKVTSQVSSIQHGSIGFRFGKNVKKR